MNHNIKQMKSGQELKVNTMQLEINNFIFQFQLCQNVCQYCIRGNVLFILIANKFNKNNK